MARVTFGVDQIGKTPTDEMWNKTLIKLRGDEWKEVRSMFSPCFTSGRMKMMTKFMKVRVFLINKQLKISCQLFECDNDVRRRE